jgi:hypothetical protein
MGATVRFEGYSVLLIAFVSLALGACDDRRQWTYPTRQTPASYERAPSNSEPPSAKLLYETACSLEPLGAGAPDGGRAGTRDAGTPDAGTPDIGTPDIGDGASGCHDGKVVHFVYFVEADRAYSECWRSKIEQQAFAFQRYWYEQLGVTFYLNEPVVDVIRADHDSLWYVNTVDSQYSSFHDYRIGNIEREVYAKLGIVELDPNHRVVNYPTTRYDGHVGAVVGGGAWMDGDDLTCMVTGLTYPYDDENPAHCIGHPAHEFGHVFGLEHTGLERDCMQYGFYSDDPDRLCSFGADNVQRILRNPLNAGWFDAEPGATCKGAASAPPADAGAPVP